MTWTLTHSGKVMDLLDPRPHMVCLDDIAIHLSRIARFSGATREFYNVADHSVFVAQIVDELGGDLMAQRAALFHDAHEAYVGDIPTPVKVALGVRAAAEITRLKARLDAAIFAAMDITASPKARALIKQADGIALAAERKQFMPAGGPDWGLKYKGDGLVIKRSCTPEISARAFKKYDWLLKAALRDAPKIIQVLGAGA